MLATSLVARRQSTLFFLSQNASQTYLPFYSLLIAAQGTGWFLLNRTDSQATNKMLQIISYEVFHMYIPFFITGNWKPVKRLDHSAFELVKGLLSWNPRNRISTVEALSSRFVGDGRMRFHSCMCSCCSMHPSGKRLFASELEPVPDRVFNDSFESNLPNINFAKGKISYQGS